MGRSWSGKEDLHVSPGETDIRLLLDVLIRHGAIDALRTDVVVILGSCHFPERQLERCYWEGQKKQLLLGKAECSAALPFLKGLVVRG